MNEDYEKEMAEQQETIKKIFKALNIPYDNCFELILTFRDGDVKATVEYWPDKNEIEGIEEALNGTQFFQMNHVPQGQPYPCITAKIIPNETEEVK